MTEVLSLIIPTFIAGVLTFLAPCTLPLVPGYLGFISGASLDELRDPEKLKRVRKKVFFNGLMYVVGFSAVFILLGSLFGLGGAALVKYRIILSRVGGVLVIIFGLYMMHILKLPFLNFMSATKKFNLPKSLKPGNPKSSFLFGATFAFGWTPCVGPILGSVLLLASSSATVGQGALLLSVFSLGLAIPFIAIAVGIGHAAQHIKQITKYLNVISVIGGAFLIFLGILLLTDSMALWLSWSYRAFSFVNYESLLDYL
jgi:cytochrome c-type biogenesis protein